MRYLARAPKFVFAAVAAAVLYVGSHLPLAGVNPQALVKYFSTTDKPLLLSIYELIGGGGLPRGAVFALSIMPYISARVFVRLFKEISPDFRRTLEEADPSYARRITRFVTTGIAVIQSVGFATFLQRVPGVVANPGPGFTATTVLTLTAGALLMMWLGEKLSERDEDEVLAEPEPTGLPAHPEVAPALLSPAPPASHSPHPRPSTDAETLRTRQ